MMIDLQLYFEEKDIPYTEWEVKCEGETHYINSQIVQEAILKMDNSAKQVVATKIFSLDFRNLSIIDYLHQLGECMIETNYNNVRKV